jgi:hypothetical protein
LEFELLFDVSLVESSHAVENVRELTQPLWNLAENAASPSGYRQPPIARFIWGKTWNVPGVVTAIAERLEQFAPSGAPQRSWLHIKFVRVNEPRTQGGTLVQSGSHGVSSNVSSAFVTTPLDVGRPAPTDGVALHEVIGATGDSSTTEFAGTEAGGIASAVTEDGGRVASSMPTGTLPAVEGGAGAITSSSPMAGENIVAQAQGAGTSAVASAVAERQSAPLSPGEGSAGKSPSADGEASQETSEAPRRGLLSRLRRQRKSGAVPTPSGTISTAEAVGMAPGKATGRATSDNSDTSADLALAPAPKRVVDHPMSQRLDEVAARYYGDPALWRLIAYYNRLDDPLHIRPGTALQIPPLSVLGGPV